MATFFTDFSEYTAGAQPSDWTARGTTTSSTWTAETGGDDKILKHTLGTSAQRWVSWDDLDGDANRDNVELLGLIYNDGLSSTQNGGGLWVRGSDSSGVYAYNCAIRSDKLRLAKYIAGTATVLSDFAGTFSAATWYWVRFRVNGTSLKARIWADGGSEPGTWDIDTTNGDVTGVGWAGASNGNASADPSFELFGVGTNGDTAPSSASSGYTLAADSGSYSLTGTAATLKVDRKLAAASGTYSLTGTDAALKFGRVLTAESGTYTLNGTAVSLLAGRKIAADSGTYSLTGTDVTLSYSPAGNYTLTADSGSYTLTGTDATLKVSRKLTADSGTYSLTGTDATLAKGFSLTAASGTYTLTGTNVAFARTYKLTAESGAYALSGTNATLTWSGAPVVVPDPGTGGGGSRRTLISERRVRDEVDEWLKKKQEAELLKRIQREDEEIVLIMALLAA